MVELSPLQELPGGELIAGEDWQGDGKHYPHEKFWVDHQAWLKDCGYTLRARYHPDWVASWRKPGAKVTDWLQCEDAVIPDHGNVLDASREDGSLVALKRIKPLQLPFEIEIGRLFSTKALTSNPRNHCVPIYDVLQVPDEDDTALLVMPLLYPNEDPPFETIGEVIEFFRQIFEGLQFMHQNNVAHRDCKYGNIMADALPLYASPPHPFKMDMTRDYSGETKTCSTRTRKPIKYYWIDFDLSRQYDPADAPPSELPIWGGDKTVPEFRTQSVPCDPFPVDVYCIGNAIRRRFLEGDEHHPARKGFDFLKDLVADMTKEDPKQRPTMNEVVTRFGDIMKRLSSWKLRSRVADKNERTLSGFIRSAIHWTKQINLIVRRASAIPTP